MPLSLQGQAVGAVAGEGEIRLLGGNDTHKVDVDHRRYPPP